MKIKFIVTFINIAFIFVCGELKVFEDVDVTVEFIETINNLLDLDVMNSRNPFGNVIKAPIKKDNFNSIKMILNDSIYYLKNIQTADGTYLHRVNYSYTYIINFSYDSLNSEEHIMYKLFYIYVEGGWNSNPTCIQFKGIFCHLLCRCCVLPSKTGNSIPLDDT